jgi:cysteine synthase
MSEPRRDVLSGIGYTSLLPLRRVVPASGASVLLKLEDENPTGSMKDRMALAMVEAAEADGRLPAGGHVVEYTGGSTGVSLSLVCAVKGHPLHVVTSDAFSREKLDHMRLLGAELHVIESDDGRMTEKLTRDMVEAARLLTEKTGGFWTNQLNNTDQLAAYHALAEEIWSQTGGRVDGFVQSVGTAASLRGTAEGLRARDAAIRIVASRPRNRRCCRAARPVRTRSTASAPASSFPSGTTASLTRSTRSRRKRRLRWRCGSRATRGCSQGRPRARTWSVRFGSRSGSAPTRPSSPSCATRG